MAAIVTYITATTYHTITDATTAMTYPDSWYEDDAVNWNVATSGSKEIEEYFASDGKYFLDKSKYFNYENFLHEKSLWIENYKNISKEILKINVIFKPKNFMSLVQKRKEKHRYYVQRLRRLRNRLL